MKMKSNLFIILTVIFSVHTVSAISINWSINGQSYFNAGDNFLGNATVVLYYASTDLFAMSDTTSTSFLPGFKGSLQDVPLSLGTIDPEVLASGYSVDFYAMITHTVGEVTYVNYSTISTATGWTDNSQSQFITLNFDWATITANENPENPGTYLDAPVRGGGWFATPVPEPATAAMALAGLALLFRRKRK